MITKHNVTTSLLDTKVDMHNIMAITLHFIKIMESFDNRFTSQVDFKTGSE
jgi:hypothetical protein